MEKPRILILDGDPGLQKTLADILRAGGIEPLDIANDMNGLEKLKKELQKAKDAAEEANRLKNEILANISHEIRTPMNGIIGMAELLSDTGLSIEQTEYVHGVKSSAESLLSVINNILSFSEIEARKLELEPAAFNLRSSLRNILNILALGASEKGLELAFRVPTDIPDFIVGDAVRLRQIVVNLVENAIKFTEIGEVNVSVNREADVEDGICLCFSVADTGIGIPAKEHERIFEAFSQVDTSMTRRHGGTGLGLTISARLVEMMEGRIWVESEVGKGSTFHFTARFGLGNGPGLRMFLEQPGAPLENHNIIREQQSPLRILLAEDNIVNQKVAVGMLEKLGHSVTVAQNGRKAVSAFRRQGTRPYDVVFMDVQMPEMDGFEATSLIRAGEMKTGGHIPIIALTAVAMKGDREKCQLAGMDGFIAKPLRAEDLFLVMEKLLASRPASEGNGTDDQRPTMEDNVFDLK